MIYNVTLQVKEYNIKLYAIINKSSSVLVPI